MFIYSMKYREPKKKKKFFCQIGNFLSGIGKKPYFLALGMGPEFRPQNRVIESPEIEYVIQWFR